MDLTRDYHVELLIINDASKDRAFEFGVRGRDTIAIPPS